MTTKETQAHPPPKEELNPASLFAHPMQVVHAKDLTTAEKRAILRSWEIGRASCRERVYVLV